MKILVSGASGLVGTCLQSYLKTCGHQLVPLVRQKNKERGDAILWHPEQGYVDEASLEDFDAVINLAGENIAGGRWNEQRKNRILSSRLNSVQTLVKAFSKLRNPPKTFISASAVGVYGNQKDRWCTEETPPGQGFLVDVCRQWEAAAGQAQELGIRTIAMRFGVVLSTKGGALRKMLPLFKLGLGGRLGPGEQYMSWIDIDDLVAIVLFALTNKSLSGPVNVVAPHPVTNAVFTKALGNVLGRPTFLAVPACMLKLALGRQMAEELLLCSTRVEPMRLVQAGYSFSYPCLSESLKHLLK